MKKKSLLKQRNMKINAFEFNKNTNSSLIFIFKKHEFFARKTKFVVKQLKKMLI